MSASLFCTHPSCLCQTNSDFLHTLLVEQFAQLTIYICASIWKRRSRSFSFDYFCSIEAHTTRLYAFYWMQWTASEMLSYVPSKVRFKGRIVSVNFVQLSLFLQSIHSILWGGMCSVHLAKSLSNFWIVVTCQCLSLFHNFILFCESWAFLNFPVYTKRAVLVHLAHYGFPVSFQKLHLLQFLQTCRWHTASWPSVTTIFSPYHTAPYHIAPIPIP